MEVILNCGDKMKEEFIYHNAENYTLIMTSSGEGICSVSIDENIRSCACIYNLSVEEKCRVRGYGNRLLEEAEKVAQKLGASVVSLAAEKDKFMADWYERKGYKPIFSDKEYITFYKSLKNENNKNRISMEIILKCGDKINVPEGCKAEIKDGVITIEKEKSTFKRGDFVTSIGGTRMGIVYEYRDNNGDSVIYMHWDNDSKLGEFKKRQAKVFRLATEEERKTITAKMAEQNLRWNAEEKELEWIRWRAEKGGYYHFINSICNVTAVYDKRDSIDDKQFLSYNYFKTKEQAEKAAELVKDTLKKFHEENS